jgi:hypothetical protein
MQKIYIDHMFERALPFLDDIGIKGPKTRYNDEEVEPRIRRFIAEHITNLDLVLADFERSGCTIAAAKSDWLALGIKVVGYVCNIDGRHPSTAKVIKILEWPEPRDVKEVRTFIGVVVYYRL